MFFFNNKANHHKSPAVKTATTEEEEESQTSSTTAATATTGETSPKATKTVVVAHTTATTATSETSQKDMKAPDCVIAIAGGGPVGLATALLLLDHTRNVPGMGDVLVRVYEPRWIRNDDDPDDATHPTFRWRHEQENNNRRWQVVTIQGNVWSALPEHVQTALFPETGQGYVEMWPQGPDSTQPNFPRNIPIRTVEDNLLALLQTTTTAQGRRPELFARPLQEQDLEDVDFVVMADGGRRQTEAKLFPGVFGGHVPFPNDPQVEIKENVLGIFVDSDDDNSNAIGVTEAEGMALTVSQNRFLLNPFGRKRGFLNMWLTPEEAKDVKGVRMHDMEPQRCTQGQPCMFVGQGANFVCPTHQSLFWPALNKSGAFYTRISQGLALYGIEEKYVKGFTMFQLGPFHRRLNFVGSKPRPGSWPLRGFVIGDAAFTISFRAGRGLNTGLKAAMSAAKTIASVVRRKQWRTRCRDSDFVPHNAFMSALQEREVQIRSIQMMTFGGSTVVDRLSRAMRPYTQTEADQCRQQFLARVELAAQRLSAPGRLPVPAPDLESLQKRINEASDALMVLLADSEPWNTSDVGGPELVPYHWPPFLDNGVSPQKGASRLEEGMNMDKILSTIEKEQDPKQQAAAVASINLKRVWPNGKTLLCEACERGLADVVHVLLHGSDVNQPELKGGEAPLFIACKEGKNEIAKLLIENGAAVNQPTHEGLTPLFVACKQGNNSLVKLLLESKEKANPNLATANGETPLLVACEENQEAIVELLLKAGAKVDSEPSPLLVASKAGYRNIAKLLLSHDMGCLLPQSTPLFEASASGDVELVKLLLSCNADPNELSRQNGGWSPGRTALFIASAKGHVEVMKLLLEHHANPNFLTFFNDGPHEDGWTPLSIACAWGHADAVLLLLEYGADPNQINKQDGWTPLDLASAKIAKLLLEHGADPSNVKKKKEGWTPLYLAPVIELDNIQQKTGQIQKQQPSDEVVIDERPAQKQDQSLQAHVPIEARAYRESARTKVGIRLKCSSSGLVLIEQVAEDGLFHNSPLKAGMQLRSVNGVSVTGKPHAQVVFMIGQTVGELRLKAAEL